jgi:shikimate dehydrogenase
MIVAGVIGDPVAQSRSPALHGHWLRRHGIDGAYVPLRVAPGDLAAVVPLLARGGWAGCNVTIPHKEAVMALCDALTDRARAAGAVNTLIFEGGTIRGDNTDGAGFVANLDAQAPGRDRGAPALVIGAGGAARGIAAALLADGAERVTLVNRTRARAEALAAALGPRAGVADWDDREAAAMVHGLIVNTTSLGMAGQPPLGFSLAGMAPGTVVADIVYAPLETPLLREARARGLVAVEGLGMLLHQAVPGFAAWFGVTPLVDDALRRAVLG